MVILVIITEINQLDCPHCPQTKSQKLGLRIGLFTSKGMSHQWKRCIFKSKNNQTGDIVFEQKKLEKTIEAGFYEEDNFFWNRTVWFVS